MNRYRISLLVIGVLAVVILIGGWFLGVDPQLSRIEAANSQRTLVLQKNTIQEARNAQLAADKAKLPELQAQLDSGLAQIPSDRSQQALIDQLNAAALASGTGLVSVTFDAPVDAVAPAGVAVTLPSSATLVTVPLTMTVAGSRANLEAFLVHLQSVPRIVSVAQTAFSNADEPTLVVTGLTYVLVSP